MFLGAFQNASKLFLILTRVHVDAWVHHFRHTFFEIISIMISLERTCSKMHSFPTGYLANALVSVVATNS